MWFTYIRFYKVLLKYRLFLLQFKGSLQNKEEVKCLQLIEKNVNDQG
jgi:hypothetical protein